MRREEVKEDEEEEKRKGIELEGLVRLEPIWELFTMMLLDYLRVFGWISEKIDEISKIWAISGVLRRSLGTLCSSLGPRQGVACPRRGIAKRRLGQASGTPQRRTVHSMKIIVFCFSVIPRTCLLD